MYRMFFVNALCLLAFMPVAPLFAAKVAAPTSSLTPPPPVNPPGLKTAQLAAGCFWGVEEYFRKVPGVKSTRVGYEGGKTVDPTYEQVSTGSTGFAETLELTYDPKVISYTDLLTHFFKMHDPTTLNEQINDKGTQYRSAIFTTNADQKKEAEQLIARIEKSKAWKSKIMTVVAPSSKFYPAEDYHQDYLIKHPGGYDNHYVRNLTF